jgi:hypothetical protein
MTMSTSTFKIYVTMEGGICQGVSTNDPALVGAEYVVIDYDTEGADVCDVSEVVQSDGDTVEAIIGGGQIDPITVQLINHETGNI